jgi:hypothetical protein
MSRLVFLRMVVALTTLSSARPVPAQPAGSLVAITREFLSAKSSSDWAELERLPAFRWAPLPPASLTNCLPNGDCFARQGTTTIDGRPVVAMATGARTIVVTLLLRNRGTPLGEAAVMSSLERAGLTVQLARCPVRAGAGGTSWYGVKGEGVAPGFLAVQPAGPGRPNEGFTITRGEELPALQPNQLALYSERCSDGTERKAVATIKPHESIAQTVVTLLVSASGPPLYDWKTLRTLSADITWLGDAPKAVDLTSLGDSNPMMLSGTAAWAGRKFSVMATGTASQVKAIRLDEQGLHPRGEHMLGVVYAKGVAVRKVRCGPVYTESTNDWYALTSAATRPASIRQSIRYDGNQVQDAYELRLDGTLPGRDPRDRNPGTAGC